MDQQRPRIMSFQEPDETWVGAPDLLYNTVYFGRSCDPSSPAAVVVRAGSDIGDRIAGARTHATVVMTVVLEGSVQLDGHWMGTGDIQLVPAGLEHGDLVVGPEGATVFVMFGERAGMMPAFADRSDQDRFDATVRGEVQAAATGASEPVLALLPRRDSHSPRRGVVVADAAEVERLIEQAAGRW